LIRCGLVCHKTLTVAVWIERLFLHFTINALSKYILIYVLCFSIVLWKCLSMTFLLQTRHIINMFYICCFGVMYTQVNKMLVWCYSECTSTPGRPEKYAWPRGQAYFLGPARCGCTLRVTSHKHVLYGKNRR
jgi:hypothetical protein